MEFYALIVDDEVVSIKKWTELAKKLCGYDKPLFCNFDYLYPTFEDVIPDYQIKKINIEKMEFDD